MGAKDESILYTMISGVSSVLKQYLAGGRPTNEGMTVKCHRALSYDQDGPIIDSDSDSDDNCDGDADDGCDGET